MVVPAYNEERGIAGTVAALRDWLQARDPRPFEVLVVDNASHDGTAAAVQPLVDGERIQLLRNERNRGKGYSVRRACSPPAASCACTATPTARPRWRRCRRCSRCSRTPTSSWARAWPRGPEVGQRQPLPRRIVGRSFVLLCRAVLSEPTTDLYCGFKLWRGPVAEDVFARIHLDGWTFDAEALAMARALGYRLRETGIVWTDREGSRLSMARVLVPVVRELIAARRHIRREARRPSAALTEAPAAEPQG